MIGERIRRLRVEKGLSQSQLAGKDMTRAFISQVENGHCTPSSSTLRILAERLGKPISYFLDEEASEDQVAKLLWDAAVVDMDQGNWEDALNKLEEALKLVRRTDDSARETKVCHMLGRTLYKLRRYEAALERLEEAQERYRSAGKTVEAAQVWLEMGHCYVYLEQYSTARRFYHKVFRHTAGMKSAQEIHVDSLCYLGTSYLRTGDQQTAVQFYHEALNACDPGFMPETWGRIATGLGAAYNRLGKPEQARDWAKRALIHLKGNAYEALAAKHNLALALKNLGQWEEAYALLQQTLSAYRDRNDSVSQANIMEDIAQYWIYKGDLDRAERLYWQAIDLISDADTARLRGLLYKRLSHIYEQRGRTERAWELLRVGCEFLRRAQAADLLQGVEQKLKELSSGA